MHRSWSRLLAILLALAVVAAACGSDDEDTDDATTDESTEESTEESTDDEAMEEEATDDEATDDEAMDEEAMDDEAMEDGTVDLAAAGCPATIVIQKDWNPEAEHGMLYELVGKEGYEIDAGAAIVSGDLWFHGDTGVDIEIRSGGPAIGFQQVTAQMYQDTAITMGYVSTDEAIQNAGEFPTIAFVAPLEINPQMIMWDPATYPDATSIADLATVEGGPVTIRYFGTATYMPDLVGRGLVLEEQLDGSYDGSPAVFVAEGGAIAQQGFASAEPYIYENEVEAWGKPVAFELIHDLGLQAYAAAMAATPESYEALASSGCLEALVPVMQQAQVDYITDPAETNELILELVTAYDNGWVYSPGVAEFSVQQQLDLGLVGNGPDSTLGNFDLDRVQGVIDSLAEIQDDLGFEIVEGLAPEDLVTNEFIDDSIGL